MWFGGGGGGGGVVCVAVSVGMFGLSTELITKGTVTLDNFSSKLCRNFVATQVARIIAKCTEDALK